MKRNLTVALTAIIILTLLLSAGCGKGNVKPSPSPLLTPAGTTKLTPMITNSPEASIGPSGAPGGSPGTSPAGTPGSTIQGFVEGGQVDPAKVPDVVDAVKAEYPDATIKSITYALRNTEQVYEVTLEGKTEKVYVGADGTIIKNAGQ
ncbi:MAG: hypothetical protein ABFC62_09185 [Clostridiaceae bacterium]|nr:PepSY domain-containing protein [Eubacteriales bacterium]